MAVEKSNLLSLFLASTYDISNRAGRGYEETSQEVCHSFEKRGSGLIYRKVKKTDHGSNKIQKHNK